MSNYDRKAWYNLNCLLKAYWAPTQTQRPMAWPNVAAVEGRTSGNCGLEFVFMSLSSTRMDTPKQHISMISSSYLWQLIWDNNSKPLCPFLHFLQVFSLWHKEKGTIKKKKIKNKNNKNTVNSVYFACELNVLAWWIHCLFSLIVVSVHMFIVNSNYTVYLMSFHCVVDALSLCIQCAFTVNLTLSCIVDSQ